MNRKTQNFPDQTDVLHTQSIIMSRCHLMINLSASTYTISAFTLMLFLLLYMSQLAVRAISIPSRNNIQYQTSPQCVCYNIGHVR